MTRIDSTGLTTNIARTTAKSAKEKASNIEKQIQNLVIDNNKKFDKNIEETTDLKYPSLEHKNQAGVVPKMEKDEYTLCSISHRTLLHSSLH